jgi:energy-coupling factor transporter ATP-binding protein EcfA2
MSRKGALLGAHARSEVEAQSQVEERKLSLLELARQHEKLGVESRLDYAPTPLTDLSQVKVVNKVSSKLQLAKNPATNQEARDKLREDNQDQKKIRGWSGLGAPRNLVELLESVNYQCYHYLAVQLALLFNTPSEKIRALLLEGPSGCGKSYMAKSLAKIAGAELMCLSCYKGMPTQNLIESPSTLAMVNAMAGKGDDDPAALLNLGILARAYLRSQEVPVLLLIDELDKPDGAIDTFFLGPIQDAKIWLESRGAISANIDNLLIVFTKNWNRTLDEALLRRVHPIKMNYLDATLERKILSPYCHPQLVDNLVSIADRMRNSGGSYQFERPPAPEELLTAGNYVTKLLEWGMRDAAFVGKSVWSILAKSEHDRAVLEHMMRFHPDFLDPLAPDGKSAPLEEIHARLGRVILKDIIRDALKERREEAWKEYQG